MIEADKKTAAYRVCFRIAAKLSLNKTTVKIKKGGIIYDIM